MKLLKLLYGSHVGRKRPADALQVVLTASETISLIQASFVIVLFPMLSLRSRNRLMQSLVELNRLLRSAGLQCYVAWRTQPCYSLTLCVIQPYIPQDQYGQAMERSCHLECAC